MDIVYSPGLEVRNSNAYDWKDAGNCNSQSLLVEIQNDIATLEKQFDISSKS